MKRLAPLALIALALAACGSDDAASVDNAWSRASAPGQTTGAVYFDLTVAEDDTLVGASVPASVATHAEIHEVIEVDESMDDMDESMDDMSGEMSGDDDMDDMSMSEGSDDMEMDMDMGDGMMMMQEMPDGLALVGGETVSFAPGGYHVMMPELVEPLEIGDEFELTLEFDSADDVTVTVEVFESAP